MIRKIIYRADGGQNTGMGHIVRGLSLEESLRCNGTEFTFVTRDVHGIPDFLRSKGLDVHPVPANMSDEGTAEEVISLEPSVVVNDIRNTTTAYVKKLKNAGIPLVAFDDTGKAASLADVLIDANISDDTLYVINGGPKRYYGARYIALNSEFEELHQQGKEIRDCIEHVLIIMGGSDPCNLTQRVIFSLDSIEPDFEVTAVAGFGFSKRGILKEMTGRRRWLTVLDSPEKIGKLMLQADIAFCSGGVSMYELACVGTPSIVLCQALHELRNTEPFAEKGIIECLGVGENIGLDEITGYFRHLAGSIETRREMSKAGREYVDGKGLKRITRIINQCTMQYSL